MSSSFIFFSKQNTFSSILERPCDIHLTHCKLTSWCLSLMMYDSDYPQQPTSSNTPSEKRLWTKNALPVEPTNQPTPKRPIGTQSTIWLWLLFWYVIIMIVIKPTDQRAIRSRTSYSKSQVTTLRSNQKSSPICFNSQHLPTAPRVRVMIDLFVLMG